jgi:hypothetical protein
LTTRHRKAEDLVVIALWRMPSYPPAVDWPEVLAQTTTCRRAQPVFAAAITFHILGG